MTGVVGAVAHARRGCFMCGVHSVCFQCVFGIQYVRVLRYNDSFVLCFIAPELALALPRPCLSRQIEMGGI
jgi:hypothetical protein